jgi:hypothetical protein
MVTLTMRNCQGEELRERIEEMGRVFRNSTLWAKRQGFPLEAVRKLECTYNSKRKDYHPHYHVIVNGRMQAELLRAAWLKRWGALATVKAQDIRSCDERSLLELFKYFTKLTTKTHNGDGRRLTPTHALDTIFQAMKGRRVWQPVGFRLPEAIEEAIEGEALDVAADAACQRVEERVFWQWQQQVHDWVDRETGETLSNYQPGERFTAFVESITADVQPSMDGEDAVEGEHGGSRVDPSPIEERLRRARRGAGDRGVVERRPVAGGLRWVDDPGDRPIMEGVDSHIMPSESG